MELALLVLTAKYVHGNQRLLQPVKVRNFEGIVKKFIILATEKDLHREECDTSVLY